MFDSLCVVVSWQADHSSLTEHKTWAHMHITHNSLSATSHRNTPSTDNRLISVCTRPPPSSRNGALFFSRLSIRPVLIFLAARRRATRINVLFCSSRSKACNINGRIIARWSAGVSLKSMFITGADANLSEGDRPWFSRLFQHISASVSFFCLYVEWWY